jgi:tRNA 2-thiouridine synthesizing protein A
MQERAAPPPLADRALLVEARGYRCPMPVILMEKALRGLAPGGALKVIADDPFSVVDIPHFARAAGALAERLPDEDGACVFLVTRAGNRAD